MAETQRDTNRERERERKKNRQSLAHVTEHAIVAAASGAGQHP